MHLFSKVYKAERHLEVVSAQIKYIKVVYDWVDAINRSIHGSKIDKIQYPEIGEEYTIMTGPMFDSEEFRLVIFISPYCERIPLGVIVESVEKTGRLTIYLPSKLYQNPDIEDLRSIIKRAARTNILDLEISIYQAEDPPIKCR